MKNNEAVTTAIKHLAQALEAAQDAKEVISLTDRLVTLLDRQGGAVRPLWTLQDVATLTNMTTGHIRRLCYSQQIPHIKIGSKTLFNPDNIKNWLKKNSVEVHKVWR